MRGKLGGGEERRAWPRIIPAHAGQTRRLLRPCRRGSDHPRACGANQISVVIPFDVNGSSPRMRGKLLRGLLGFLSGRIIPAHAGQTAVHRPGPYSGSDHPRACGANDRVSPTMNVATRIIPAHAGQTPRFRGNGTFGADHPRACGANVYAA